MDLEKPRYRVPAVSVSVSPRILKAKADGSLEGGRYARRLSSFLPSRSHINTLISSSGNTVLARARYLVRNNGYALSAVECFAGVTVGIGIYPSLAMKDNAELRSTIHSVWKRWCKVADSEGLTDFYGMLRRIAGEIMIAGECFVRKRYRYASDGLIVPFQLQMLPSEMLDSTYTVDLGGGRSIRQGIEFNAIGKRVAYWFFRGHPNDSTEMGFGRADRVRVPAEEVMHILDPKEAGQIRGLSKFAPAIVKLWTLDQYDDAELERKKVAALFTGFIQRPDPQGKFFDEDGDNEGVEDNAADTGRADITLEPGAMHVLDVGEEVEFAQPADSGSSYEPFQYRTLLQICAALGVPYNSLTGDMTKANYSSLRAALLELRRRVEALQYSVLVQLCCQPVWVSWFEQAVMVDAFKGGVSRADYLANKADYEDVDWLPPKWEWVDPEKDAKAEILLIDNLIKSRSQVVRERGEEPDEVAAEIAEDKKRDKVLGIEKKVPPPAAPPGQNPKSPPTENPEDDSEEESSTEKEAA